MKQSDHRQVLPPIPQHALCERPARNPACVLARSMRWSINLPNDSGTSSCPAPSCSSPVPFLPKPTIPQQSDLPRLVIDFNRRDFGRLSSLIGAINDY